MTSPTTETAVAKARQLVEARIDAVRPLAEAYANLTNARTALNDAEIAAAAAYRTAERAGWTATELKGVGFEAPIRKAPGRPRGSRGNGGGTAATGEPDGAAAGTGANQHQE